MKPTRPIVAITMGDPAGIGPELIVNTLHLHAVQQACTPLVLGDLGVLKKARRETGVSLQFHSVGDSFDLDPSACNVMNLSTIDLDLHRWGKPRTDQGLLSAFYSVKAAELMRKEAIGALVTCPIDKKSLHHAGYDYPGNTELLLQQTDSREAFVLLAGETLKIMQTTAHLPLSDVGASLKPGRISRCIRMAAQALKKDFDTPHPRIGVCGVNPHAGMNGFLGREELDIIRPAIEAVKTADGLDVEGPLPADELFSKAMEGRFDLVVTMYHDQGFLPFHLMEKDQGINVTYGMPVVKASTGHEPHYDIAGQGKADVTMFRKAVLKAARIASHPAWWRIIEA